MRVLAIDLGKTGCRVLRREPYGRQWQGQGSGALGMSHPEGPASALAAIERALAAGQVPDEELDVVCLGAAGVAAAQRAAEQMAGLLADRFRARALVTSDSITSHAGALDGAGGVVLAVGTGSVAITFDDAGDLVQVDGWGQTLGDEGSGWWFGREGLMAAVRALDERGPRTALLAMAQEDFGDLRGLPARLGDATASIPVLASFGPRVVAATEAGDEVAVEILTRGADALGTTVGAAARRAARADHALRCCFIGGLVHWPDLFHALVLRGARAHAGIDLDWVSPVGSSVEGAALIAARADLPHRGACVSTDPAGSDGG